MGHYYNPNPPHVGNQQPLEQRKLVPPQSGPPPQNPPFPGSRVGLETLICWAAAVAPVLIILPQLLAPQPVAAKTPYNPARYDIIRAWDPPAPAPITAINLDPPISGPTPQNPPIVGAVIPLAVQVAWIPPPPMYQVAINLDPPIGIVAPTNPPFAGTFVSREVLVAWLPPQPAPIVAINLDPPIAGPTPQNPPFAGTKVPTEVQVSWLPPAPAPIVAVNGLPQSAPVPFFPYIGSIVPQSVLVSWLPLPPAPITAVNLDPPISAPQNPPFMGGAKIPDGLLVSWLPPAPMPITGPLFTAGAAAATNPPFRGTWVPTEVLVSWIPPPPLPTVNTLATPPTGPVQVSKAAVGWPQRLTRKRWDELFEEERAAKAEPTYEEFERLIKPSKSKRAIKARKEAVRVAVEAVEDGLLSELNAKPLVEAVNKTLTASKVVDVLEYALQAREYIDRLREEDDEETVLKLAMTLL